MTWPDDPVVDEAQRLLNESRATNELGPLQEARALLEGAPVNSARLNVLSRVYRDLHVHLRQIDFLDRAADAARRAEQCPDQEWDLVLALNHLGQALADRYEETGHVPDLDESERVYRRAIVLRPAFPVLLGSLATVLRHRHDLTGDPALLGEMVDLCRRAVALPGHEPSHDSMALTQLSDVLMLHYLETHDVAALRESVDAAERAAGLGPLSVEHRAGLLNRWATSLIELFSETLDPAALDQAEQALRESLDLVRPGHRTRGQALIEMCNVDADRYRLTGDPVHLDAGIDRGTAAIAEVPEGSMNFGGLLHTLASLWRTRFETTGAPAALEAAISLLRRAVEVLPTNDTSLPNVLSTLGGCLQDRAHLRFDRAAAERDRAEALQHLREAVRTAPETSALRTVLLSNLVVRLLDEDLLAEAEEIHARTAARLTPESRDHHLLVIMTATIAMHRADRGMPVDLGEPERLLRTELARTARNDRARTVYRFNLARILSHRLTTNPDPSLRAELDELEQVLATGVSPPLHRIRAGVRIAWTAAQREDWATATTQYREAIDALAALAPRAWRRSDRLTTLRDVFTIASEAAASAIRAGQAELAVELLEQGRAVVVDYPQLERASVQALRATAPDLADRYTALVGELARHNIDEDVLTTALEVEQRHRSQRAYDDLLAEIRRVDARFLLPPPCPDLVGALGERQVVIVNVAEAGCDALLVGRGEVRVVPLPLLTFAAAARQAGLFRAALDDEDVKAGLSDMHAVLTWLWRTTVEPVLDALDNPTRIWWCPTGFMHTMPLHAAGVFIYRHPSWTGAAVAGEATIDRVVSSYTPTIRMLADALARPPLPARRPRVLATGLSVTEHGHPLANATLEARAVAEQVGAGTLLLDGEATHARLLTELDRHTWLHFAGHGRLDDDRPDSALLFPYDHVSTGPLTSQEIAGLRLVHAGLAFLSACDTARERAALADEPMHLAGAFQQAGFREVVATRWPVADRIAREVARQFYERLTADPQAGAAEALHHAVRAVRSGSSRLRFPRPALAWAAYIHSGL